MKKLYSCGEQYAKNKLWNIRNDVVLNSIYYSDYENRYGYDVRIICHFFDSYLEYLEERMYEDIPNYKDDEFLKYLPKYDTKNNLWTFYYCVLDETDF